MGKISITLGAIEPPLVEQLKGFAAKKDLQILDRMSSAITLLYIEGILPPLQVDMARKRLMKRIITLIEKEAKP